LSVFDLPAGVVLGVVVSGAEGGDVRGVCVAAVGPGFGVVGDNDQGRWYVHDLASDHGLITKDVST